MSVTFIGFIGFSGTAASDGRFAAPDDIDFEYLKVAAQTQEEGGFDRVLIPYLSTSPDSQILTAYLAAKTEKLGFMVAHRPGFAQPTVAARQLATLDALSRGRTAVHVITGARDAELAGDGDHLNKEDRYRRTDEYLDVMRKEWFSETPFDHQGRFYDVRQAFSPMRPSNLPVFFGGSSDLAIEIAAKHADVYATWGEPLEQVRLLVEKVRGAAAKFGRRPGFSLSLRPIIAGTEEAAWKRANDIVERVREAREKAGPTTKNHAAEGAGSQRLLDAASRGYRVDKCLWTGLAIALLFKLTVREPDRDAAPPLQGGPKSYLRGFFAVFGRPAFLLVCLGGACTGIVTSSKYFWLPSFFVRSYKLSIVEVGATLGMIQFVCGVCGTLLGSWLSDFFARKRLGAPARIAGLGSVLAGIAFAGMLLSGSPAMSFLLYVLVAFFERFHGGPLATAAQFLVGQRHRSTASSVLNIFAIGGGTVFGAAIVGFISDQLSPVYAENSLRYGMFVVSFIYFAGAISFFAAARRMDGLLQGEPEAAE